MILTNEQVEIEFSKIIRKKMTNEEFWNYIAKWYEPESVIEIMESWDTGLKREAIEEYYENHQKETI